MVYLTPSLNLSHLYLYHDLEKNLNLKTHQSNTVAPPLKRTNFCSSYCKLISCTLLLYVIAFVVNVLWIVAVLVSPVSEQVMQGYQQHSATLTSPQHFQTVLDTLPIPFPDVPVQNDDYPIPAFLIQTHRSLETLQTASDGKFAPDTYGKCTKGRYTRQLFTDEMNIKVVEVFFPWLLETYHAYPRNIQRVDIARLAVLYVYGGFYSDLDIVMLCGDGEDATWKLDRYRNFTGVLVPRTEPVGVSNDLMIASPRHPFILHLIHRAAQVGTMSVSLPYLDVMLRTGPLLVSLVAYSWPNQEDLWILPNYLDGTLGHIVGRSWQSWDGVLLQKFFDTFNHYASSLPYVALIVLLLISMYTCRNSRLGLQCKKRCLELLVGVKLSKASKD